MARSQFDFVASRWRRAPYWTRSINGRLAWWLAGITAVLFLLVGVVNRWRHGGGEGSAAVSILWHTVWIAYQCFKIWLIVVIVVLLYRRFQGSSE